MKKYFFQKLNNFFSIFFKYIYFSVLILMLFLSTFLNFASANTSHTGTVDVNASVVYIPQRLVFVSSPQILEKNEISSNYTLQVQDNFGHKVEVTQDTAVILATTSPTGEFSEKKDPFVPTSSIIIKAGESDVDFYYKDSTVGTYNISANCVGLTTASQPVTIIDTIPPNPPVIISPYDNAIITNTRTPTIIGTADTDSIVIIEIDGISYTASVDNSGNWQITWPISLSNKTYKIVAKARDEHGNESKSVSINITIDIPSPPSPSPSPTPPVPTPTGILELDITANNIGNRYYADTFKQTKAVFSNNNMEILVKPSYDKEIKSVLGYFESVVYVMKDTNNDGIYETDILAPWYSGTYELKAVVNYKDGQTEEINVDILVDPFGFVYEVEGGKQKKLPGALVILYVYKDGKWQIWDAQMYNQVNPQLTKDDGVYGFIVPEGLYYLEARKDGYELYKSESMQVLQGYPINIDIMMNGIGAGGIIDDFINYIKNFVANFSLSLAPFVYNDFVQEAYLPANIITGVAVALSALAVAMLNFSLLSPFSSLIAKLLLLFGVFKKSKKPWGIVYDSENYKPIPMSVVQIFDKETNRILETQVTDDEGRFGFLVKKGEYFINVVKKNYLFPSKLQNKDYHKEIIKVKEDNAIININIPLDPEFDTLTKRTFAISRIHHVLNIVRYIFLGIGTILTFAFAIVISNTLNVILFFAYIFMWLYELYSHYSSTKGYSKVISKDTKKAVELGIVRIFDEKNKIVGTKVTNINGNFNFLVKKGKHYLVITKENYRQYKSENIDFQKNTVIKKEFLLEKNADQ